LVVITFFLGAANLMEGYNILAPYKGTNFSENYSPDEFDKIKLGMSIDEVKAIIGNPMYISQDTLPNKTVEIFYEYTDDGSSNDFGDWVLIKDYAWYRSSVTFNQNHIAVYIDKGWSYD
jgi:hypothetical protein